ncbi:MAG: hypothetical protein ACFWUD_03175 [Thermocaproicibacter melissae]
MPAEKMSRNKTLQDCDTPAAVPSCSKATAVHKVLQGYRKMPVVRQVVFLVRYPIKSPQVCKRKAGTNYIFIIAKKN